MEPKKIGGFVSRYMSFSPLHLFQVPLAAVGFRGVIEVTTPPLKVGRGFYQLTLSIQVCPNERDFPYI